MTDRPLARFDRPIVRFHEGRLERDWGGVYEPISRFGVINIWASFGYKPGPDAARYVQDCRNAIIQHDKAMEEAE